MTLQSLPTLPAAPVRSSPSTFSARMDSLAGIITALPAALNTRIDYIESLPVTAIPEWSSGASYTALEDCVWSSVDYLTYRAKTTHSGEVTDPSSDTTNWQLASGVPSADQSKLDHMTITSAADLDAILTGPKFTADGSISAGDVVILKSATGKVAAVTPSPSDADDWIGLAAEAASDGETLSVTLKNGVNTQQSGLTIGAVYYVDDDGTLTVSTSSGRKLGRALSATEILVTEGNAA